MEEVEIQKKTPTDHPILDVLKTRWSPRVFSPQPITEQQVKKLLEAGRWAPSSYNMQPWRVIWGIKGSETYDRIFDCLNEFNQGWAHSAQVLWLNAYKTDTNDDSGDENKHALHDLGLFMGNVLTQAEDMGIAVHQMAGIGSTKAKKEFNFPENYVVATGVAFGHYGGNPEKLDEELQEQELETERKRLKQQEFAFNGNFEQ